MTSPYKRRVRNDLVALTDAADADHFESIEKNRTHMGASVIGDECSRKIWLQFRKAASERPKGGRMNRLLNFGNREESEFNASLDRIGNYISKTDTPPTTEDGLDVFTPEQWTTLKQIERTVGSVAKVGFDQMKTATVWGHFGGSIDGACHLYVTDPDGLWFLLEFKTYNDARFKALKKAGVEVNDPKYWAQLHAYMGLMGFQGALFWAINKNNSERYCEEVPFAPAVFSQLESKAKALVYAKNPPPQVRGHGLSFWQCKRFCDFNHLCHLGADHPGARTQENCRTCQHGEPGKPPDEATKGKWVCHSPHQANKVLDSPSQMVGCSRYVLRILN